MPRTVPNWLPGEWLPEDKRHPIRPDWPWFRHLTFAEGHAIEIGIGIAVLLYLAATVGELGAAFPILLYTVRVAIGKKREKGKKTECDHTLGIHDIRSDPWYFVMAALVTAGVLLGVLGWP